MNSMDEAIDSVGKNCDEKRKKQHSDDEKRRKLHSDALRTTMQHSLNVNTDGRNQAVQDAHRTNPSTLHTQSSNANMDARNQAVHDAKKQMTWDSVFDGVLPPGV
jgi:hypothetical protein